MISRSFTQTFNKNFLRKILSFIAFCREQKKDGNHSVKALVNMVDGVEQVNLNSISFIV